MAKLADYAHARQCARERQAASDPAFTLLTVPARAGALDEHISKRLLADAGIAVTRDSLLTLEPDAAACADLPYPLALKIVSPDILHKTDVGGVKLGVSDADALAAAAAEIATNVRRGAPGARLDGLLACEMVTDGVETIAGVVNDPGFGPVVVFGLGGIFTEVLHDVTYRVAPFGLDEAKSMIAELRGAALFGRVRGQPARDVDALADALVRVSQLAWHLRDRLAQLDINPLLVLPAGRGVVAADALVVLR
jgi:acyl-CoA synthetase (NDP forming)